MKLGHISIAAIAAMIATPAMAQEESQSGIFAGVFVGYDNVTITDSTSSGSKDGVTYGGIVGYDYDLGSAVVGLEGEFGDSSVSDTQQDLLVTGDTATTSVGRDLYVGARVGFKAGENILVYAKGGYTNTRFKLVYDDNDGTAFTASDDLDGYRIGAGVEFGMGQLRIRGEYRYSDYGNLQYQGTDLGVSSHRHQVVATLLGKF
jgi:outer membrane immunogenic protein